jgi:uncharacterized protein
MISRRSFFKWLGHLAVTGMATTTYALIIEPSYRLRIQTYALKPPRWTPGLKLRIAILSDPHLVKPHMPLSRWEKVIAAANALEPDMTILLGDYLAGHFFRTGTCTFAQVARAATQCKSRLGTFAILGNHDWWEDLTAQKKGQGPTIGQKALEDVGIPVLENKAMRISNGSLPFWLTGTSSIVAVKKGRGRFEGRDDLPGTLAQVTDDAPIIHLAHEPDLFTQIPDRVSITLSGHTHGGQIRLFGYSPVTPSSYGNRFAYGHVVEQGRHLVVSGGLGCSILPVRFGVPPEITVLELG